ncbi:hypothetical protein HNQ80_002332 [Anaerosolibacter carboniphilus]|uniref:Uncharacterized protein n=1 Tax=Anaerosolibacter carboniphilus TaxID=1417629 RepID=A0A841KS59_9FIRM|nr:hypothetical protein [Anaerosolibacter carboniphilus]MBB6216233.1 hypothetical protein [Anaerosolibacter carboniphilus]
MKQRLTIKSVMVHTSGASNKPEPLASTFSCTWFSTIAEAPFYFLRLTMLLCVIHQGDILLFRN